MEHELNACTTGAVARGARTWPATVAHALRDGDAGNPSGTFTFVRSPGSRDGRAGDARSYGWAELYDAALARAAAFRAEGLRKGDRLVMVLPDNEQFALSFLGAALAGIMAVPVYPPYSLEKIDSYLQHLERIAQSSGARAALVPGRFVPFASAIAAGARLIAVESLDLAAPRAGAEPQISPEDVCFLQYTSGSTADPKGVRVTHGNLAANTAVIANGVLRAVSDVERPLSWLPLYHDMGLIGFMLTPLFARTSTAFLPPLKFMKDPTCWLEEMHKRRSTITGAPNFALALATKYMTDEDVARWDLSSLRVIFCGAEPIHAPTVRAFTRRLAPSGLDPAAFTACYGLAEATLAVSCAPGGLRTDRVDPEALGANEARSAGEGAASEIVACGAVVADHELRILDSHGHAVPDRVIGEIAFRGPSVADGYEGRPEATAEAFHEGWLRTGDLGYLVGGILHVCGRRKDLIILNGRNYHPQDVEWAAASVAGIRKGSVVAFGVPRGDEPGEELVIVAEWSGDEAPAAEKLDALNAAVARAARDALGIVPARVALVPPKSIPKTSSGKVRRSLTREMYERGQLTA